MGIDDPCRRKFHQNAYFFHAFCDAETILFCKVWILKKCDVKFIHSVFMRSVTRNFPTSSIIPALANRRSDQSPTIDITKDLIQYLVWQFFLFLMILQLTWVSTKPCIFWIWGEKRGKKKKKIFFSGLTSHFKIFEMINYVFSLSCFSFFQSHSSS